MTQTCPRCERAMSTDAFACATCAREARRDLTEAADFLSHIDDKRARRGSRLWIGQGGSGGETPLPYDSRVGKTLDPIRNSLTTWARIHHNEHHDHSPVPTTLDGIAAWLADHTEWAAHQAWAHEAFEDFARTHDSLKALFDCPPDREAIGVCGTEIEDVVCTEILSAIKGETNHSCPRCGSVHDVKDRREKLLQQAGDFTVSVAEAVKLLRTSERDVHPRLVRAAIRYVPIHPTGDRLERDKQGSSHRVSVYRLGSVRDALDLYDGDSDTRKAINRVMRGQRDTAEVRMRASEAQCS